MPSIENILNRLMSEGEAALALQPKVKNVSGTFNTVLFAQTDEMMSGSTKIAISAVKGLEDKETQQAVANVQALLIERGVNMQFIQSFVFYNRKGNKYSLQASEFTLHHLMKKQRLTRGEIKEIIGQLLLGLQALHEKNLVHRDLKTSNMLVTKDPQGRLFVQICDLDSMIPVDAVNGSLANEENFILLGGCHPSPEIEQFIVPTNTGGKRWNETEETRSIYKNINLKAVDCYALGSVVNALLSHADQQYTQAELDSILKLSLCETLPENRSTVFSACENPFFGETKNERDAFFNALRDRASPLEFIGKYRARAFEPNNNFLLLHEHLPEVVLLAKKLQSQLDYFNYISTVAFNEKSLDLFLLALEASFKRTVITIKTISNEIDETLKKFNQNSKIGKLLVKLKIAIAEQFEIIKTKFDLDMIKEMVAAINNNKDALVVSKWVLLTPTLKNVMAQFLENERLFYILERQPDFIDDFKNAITLLESEIHEKADHTIKPMAEKVLTVLRDASRKDKHRKYLVSHQHFPLLTELAHRIVISLNDLSNIKNIERLKEIRIILSQIFRIMHADLVGILYSQMYEMKRNGLSFSGIWLFAEKKPEVVKPQQTPKLTNSEYKP